RDRTVTGVQTCALPISAHKAGAQEQIKAAESDSVDYTDEIGRYVRLPKHPLRIVSLAPSVTEVLYLLGAQDRLVGVTTHCDWPEDRKSTRLNSSHRTIS